MASKSGLNAWIAIDHGHAADLTLKKSVQNKEFLFFILNEE